MAIRNSLKQIILTFFIFVSTYSFEQTYAKDKLTVAVPKLKYGQPNSEYFTYKEYDQFTKHFSKINNENYNDFRSAENILRNKQSATIYKYLYARKNGATLSLYDLDKYIDKYKDWPGTRNIQYHAEKNFNIESPKKILDFFQKHEPVSNNAWLLFGQTALRYNQTLSAKKAFQTYFKKNDFNSTELRSFLRKYSKYLNSEDYQDKVVTTIDRQRYKNAMVIAPMLDHASRILITKIIAIKNGNINEMNSFLSSSKQNKSQNYLNEYAHYLIIKYFYKKEDIVQAVKLLQRFDGYKKELKFDEEKWFTLQRLIYLQTIKDKNYALAYESTSKLNFENVYYKSELLFYSGFTALRYLRNHSKSLEHFKEFSEIVSTPISKSRGFYWLGRVLSEKPKLDKNSAQYYFKKASNYNLTFYGQLGSLSLRKPNPINMNLYKNKYNVSAKKILKNDMLVAFDTLYLMGKVSRARELGYSIINTIDNIDQAMWVGDFFAKREFEYLAIRLMKKFQKENIYVPKLSFPTKIVSQRAKSYASPEFIFAITRQESEFNSQIISRSNANGLMQLKKSTAKYTARDYRHKYDGDWLLQDADYNMLIGAAHLNLLMNRFDQNIIMTIAGYNAGPHRVDQWVETYGRPGNDIDPIDWMELIPYSETRNYLQRVMENKQIYRAIFDPDGIVKPNTFTQLGY